MSRRHAVCDLALQFLDVFAAHPPPEGCPAGTWARLEQEASRLCCGATDLPAVGPPRVTQLHTLSLSTGRCLRLLAFVDLRAPLVRYAMTLLRAIIDGLEASVADAPPPNLA